MDEEKVKTKKVVSKTTTKKTVAKKATEKKTTEKKPTAKKTTAKKTTTEKKVVEKKTTTKKAPKEEVKVVEEKVVEIEKPVEVVKEEPKKVVKPKKATINLKNKKEAAKALSKSKATPAKAKKKPVKKDILKNVNIIPKEEPKLPVEEEKKKEEAPTENKQELKAKRKEERAKKRAEKKKKKEEKKRLKQEKKKAKAPKKKEEKPKIVLPKEWAEVGKNKRSEKKETEFTNTNTLTNMFKKSLFEEVDEQTYKEEKKKKKEKRKKRIIVFLIIAVVLVVAGYLLLKYNDFVKKQLAVYDVYNIGDKVSLEDDSVWYVVEDSDAHSDTVKLLKETAIDITGDDQITEKDKMKYNMDNKAEYDIESKGSGPYYINRDYKTELEKKVGHIESIGLLETKEFIKIRDRMEFGDEWSEGNWLANSKLGNWWIESEQNQKVFAVSPNGSFKLYYAKSYNFIRPVIIVKKDLIKPEESDTVKRIIDNNIEKKD